MEAYQPLNTYSYCQTNRKEITRKKFTQANHIQSEVNYTNTRIFFKYLISVLAILIIVIAATVFVKIEASEPISTVAAEGEMKVVVGSGDTLWKLANTYYSDVDDTGFAVYLIKERNGLNHNTIHPGQTIILPEIK